MKLSVMVAGLKALRYVKTVKLVDIPRLNKLTLRAAFLGTEEVLARNASKLEEVKELKEVIEAEKERRRREEEEWAKKTIDVRSMVMLKNENCLVGKIVVASNTCNETNLVKLDLSRFVNLRELKVGDECFENVEEVKLIGLHALERVVIGENSFTKCKNNGGNDPNRHFHLKDCERLKELKMDRFSFSDFAVCEIANVPSLEVIEMGELKEVSDNFFFASLELKSDGDGMQ